MCIILIPTISLSLLERYQFDTLHRFLTPTPRIWYKASPTCNTYRLPSTSPFKTLSVRSLCRDQGSDSEVVDSEFRAQHRCARPTSKVRTMRIKLAVNGGPPSSPSFFRSCRREVSYKRKGRSDLSPRSTPNTVSHRRHSVQGSTVRAL
jgi:hypothetical protein